MYNEYHNSTIAKLMANENVEVIHGDFATASFDPTNRVLRLPIWKDLGKDVYDLLVGHEVGHALFTPAEGWHGVVTDATIPASLVNIVEDVRIERAIQAKYPGLVRSFVRGYKVLFSNNFFGTEDRTLESYGFVDRLNIKSKLQHLVDVEFNDREQELYDMAQDTHSFDEVLEVCRAIQAYLAETKQEKQETPTPEDFDESVTSSADGDQSELTEDDGEESDEESTESEDDSEDESEDESDSEGESQPEDGEDDESDEVISETDNAFRDNEQNLNEEQEKDKRGNDINVVVATPTLDEYEKQILKPEDVFAQCPPVINNPNNYKAFLPEARKAVNIMIQEFELKKNAYRSSRATQHKKGTINPSKLHSYKFNEDIFNKMTRLADAKSHGMVAYVDFSASMANQMDGVVKQTIQLAMFCRAVGIPFVFYSFTSSREYTHENKTAMIHPRELDIDNLKAIELFSSKQSKASFEKMADLLITQSEEDWKSWPNDPQTYTWRAKAEVFSLSSTPLDEMIIHASKFVPVFKNANNVQKMSTIFITDGDSNITHARTKGSPEYFISRSMKCNINGVWVRGARHYLTENLFKALQETVDTKVIGFFIANTRNDANNFAVRRLRYTTMINGEEVYTAKAVQYQIRKHGAFVTHDIDGIDTQFITLGSLQSGTDSVFEVHDDASKAQVTKQFGKFMKSKKTNRFIATTLVKSLL